jgi:integrase
MQVKKRNKKAKPRFNLKAEGDPKDPKLIFLIYRYLKDADGKRNLMKYSTGMRVRQKNWDPKLYRAKAGVNLPEEDAKKINDSIRLIEDTCLAIVKDRPSIAISDFKNELDYVLGIQERPKAKEDITFNEYFWKFIRKSNHHDRTIAKFMGTHNLMKLYEDHLGEKIRFDQITPEFSENLANWLYKKKKHSANTASKHIQIVRQVVEDAHENGYHNNVRYKSKKFNVKRVKTSKHYLELAELEKFAQKELTEDHLIKTRDLWVIAAYTGLRYSDFSRLNKKHIKKVKGKMLIVMNTYKGRDSKDDTQVVIPVLPELKAILEKYNFEPPQAYSSQKMNTYIKDAAAEAELDRMVEIKKSVSGKIKNSTGPLHKQITNHTARYTFINIMLNEVGLKPQRLQKITGQTLKVLAGYDRGDKTKNALEAYADIIDGMEKTKLRVV